MVCGQPKKSQKDRKAWSSRGAKGERCTKEGGSIRAGPRAQEEGQPSPVLFSISKQRWRREQSLAGFAACGTLLDTAGPFRARPTA